MVYAVFINDIFFVYLNKIMSALLKKKKNYNISRKHGQNTDGLSVQSHCQMQLSITSLFPSSYPAPVTIIYIPQWPVN